MLSKITILECENFFAIGSDVLNYNKDKINRIPISIELSLVVWVQVT